MDWFVALINRDTDDTADTRHLNCKECEKRDSECCLLPCREWTQVLRSSLKVGHSGSHWQEQSSPRPATPENTPCWRHTLPSQPANTTSHPTCQGGRQDWDNNGPNVNDHLDLKYGDLFWWELSAYYSWLGPEIWWMTQNNLCCCVTLTGREKKSYTKENTKSILQDFLHRIGQLYVSADLTRASRGYLCWANYSYNDTSCLTSLCSAEFKNSNLLASIFQWPQECWKLVWILLAGWKSWSGRSSKHFPTGYIHHTGHVMRGWGGGGGGRGEVEEEVIIDQYDTWSEVTQLLFTQIIYHKLEFNYFHLL